MNHTINDIWARVRRNVTDRNFIGFVISVAVILVVATAFFYPDALEGGVLRQDDTRQGLAISHEVTQWREQTGETARWTDALFGGMPTFQISPEYGSSGMIKAVEKIYTLGLPSPVNLMFGMMAGFFILLLCMRVKWYLALPGAIAYGFSSYFIIIIGAGHIWKFITLSYVPPTIGGMVLCYRGRYLAGTALASLFAMLQIGGNHIQMSYYFLMVVAGFAIAYLVILLRKGEGKQWLKATGCLVVAALLAVTANMPNLYNTYKYSKETIRGQHSELTPADGTAAAGDGLDRDYITAWSYGKGETFSLLIPNVKGGATIKPEKGSHKLMSLYDTDAARDMVADGKLDPQIAEYLRQLPQYFGDQPMTNGPVYVGALFVALFIFGCIVVRGPIKWMLLVVTLLSIGLSWGHNMMWLTDLMIDYMPMYNKFRTVASILVVAEFTIPLLGMLALSQLVTHREEWVSRYRKPFMISFGICALLCLVGMLLPEMYGNYLSEQEAAMYGSVVNQAPYDRLFAAVNEVRMSMVSADAMRSLLFVLLGGGLIWMYAAGRMDVRVLAVALVAVTIADLYVVGKRYVDTESFVPRQLAAGDPFPLTQADRQILADTSMNYRVMDIPRFTQADPSYHHKTIGGYHAAKLTRYQDLIDRHIGAFAGNGEVTEADMNVLNMLNAKYIVLGEDKVVENPAALGNAWFVDSIRYVDGADAEMAALDVIHPAVTAVADSRFAGILGDAQPAKAPGDTIIATSYAPDRLTFTSRSANGGVGVFSEIYFPWGWEARIDGKPAEIGRVDYVLRALRLPAGEHDVEMVFRPASVSVTVTWARVAIILIYILVAGAAAWALMCPKTQSDTADSKA